MITHAAWVIMGRRDKPGDDEVGLDNLKQNSSSATRRPGPDRRVRGAAACRGRAGQRALDFRLE